MEQKAGMKSGQYNFRDDLPKGEKGEICMGRFLRQRFGMVYQDKLFNKDYDLAFLYKNKTYTYEVKTDLLCKPGNDTGNMAIETESRGKLSGINATSADYYIYFFPYLNEVWIIETEKLKTLIDDNNFRLINGGDKGSNTKFYLLPKTKFKDHFKFYKWRNK